MTSLSLDLALQGGGAHGAFTWGVLDRLLQEPGLSIARISGCSAGALNGAALASGWARGGPEGARQSLAMLWQRAAAAGLLGTLMMLPWRKPSLGLWDDCQPLLSPSLSNPWGIQPLREVLGAVIDVDALRSDDAPALYVNAVRVKDGVTRVFTQKDLSLEALLASACAPQLFSAVTVDGDAYWDGSYTANPVLGPLYHDREAADILLVELTPRRREDMPVSAKNILNRLNEIATVNALAWEMARLEAYRQARPGIRMHVLSIPDTVDPALMDPSLKRSADQVLFESLRAEGIGSCERWLAGHRKNIGRRSSVDITARFIAPQQAIFPDSTALA